MEAEHDTESMSLMVDYNEIMELLGIPSEPLRPVEDSVGAMTQDQVNNNTMSAGKDNDNEVADQEPLYEDITSNKELYEGEEQGCAAAAEPNNVSKSCQQCGITPGINALFLLPKINENSDMKTLQENVRALTCVSYQQGQINNIQKKLDTMNNTKDHNFLS